jgi:hypothetical protein
MCGGQGNAFEAVAFMYLWLDSDTINVRILLWNWHTAGELFLT